MIALSEIARLASATFRLIGFVINVIILVWFVISLYHHGNKHSQTKSKSLAIRCLPICAIISMVGFTLIQLLSALMLLHILDTIINPTILQIINSIINVSTIIITMILFVLRLYKSFDGSIYKLTNIILIFYLIFIFIIFCLFLFSEITSYMYFLNYTTSLVSFLKRH